MKLRGQGDLVIEVKLQALVLREQDLNVTTGGSYLLLLGLAYLRRGFIGQDIGSLQLVVKSMESRVEVFFTGLRGRSHPSS